MARVYLSSTLLDLKLERAAVTNWLGKNHQLRHSYVADDEAADVSCLADIAACDLYVLILGHRYGFVPEAGNPGQLSITQLEFREAGRLNVPRVALIARGAADISVTDIGDPERYPKVKAFRDEVSTTVRPALFGDEASLIAELSAGVERVLAKRAAPKPEPTKVAAPRLRQPLHAFVGRAEQVRSVLDGLARGRREFAFVFLAGVGKTAMAAELLRSTAVAERFPDGVLWARLGRAPDVRRQLGKWATALGFGDEQIKACASAEDLAEAITRAIDRRRLLLVIDDVWSTEAGASFKLGGEGCAYVFTSRFTKVARDLMPTAGHVITVPKFTAAEGFTLLAELAPNAAGCAPQVLARLAERVDGLPIALVLIGNMLKAEGDDERAIRCVEAALASIAAVFRKKKLAEFDDDQAFTLGEVIEASYAQLGKGSALNDDEPLSGDALRGALEALAILRPDPSWFSTALAELIMEAPAAALFALADVGLIEEVRYPGDAGEDSRRYTMHRVVAEYLRTKLSVDRAQTLKRRAADYYLEQLRKLESAYQASGGSNYGAMYRYENPEWQDCQDNWLYFFEQTGFDAEASLSFLNVWFDGFWWWACFTDEGFDFCDQLLLEWEHRLTLSASAPDASGRLERRVQGLDLLHRFKQSYPKETVDRSSGDWSEVAETLLTLRRMSRLEGAVDSLQLPAERHVRALTDLFLAEAARFGRGDFDRAASYYLEAQRLFRVDEDTWNVAWSLYHLADMHVANGQGDTARPLAAEALTLGAAGGDFEVIALAERVLGDVALATGDLDTAQDHFRRAVESAYRFQVEPCNPDDYTLQFYADMGATVAGRLLNAAAPGGEGIAQRLRRLWLDAGVALAAPASPDALLGAGDAEALRALLFPPPLAVKRRKNDGAAYAETVRAVLRRLPD